MKIDLNKIISALIIIIGHGFFFLNIGYSIPFAIISIISTFLIWMLWTKLVNTFNLNVFFNLIAFSGLIVSITTFAYFGIEPIVYVPENPSYPLMDEKLIDEVPRTSVANINKR